MYIDRLVEKELSTLLNDNKIILLLGARQVGKTTLMEPFVRRRDGILLNCDIEVDRARLLAASTLSPQDAMQSLGNPSLLVIDEAQNLPEIGRIVKGWYDAKVSTKIVLLGSSSLNLLDQAAEPLTGRNEKIHLTPLLFSEVIRSQSWYSSQFTTNNLKTQFAGQIQTLLMQQMVFGGYPEAVKTADKEKYLLNLTSDYLLRDVLQSGRVKGSDAIKRLLGLLAYQTGNDVSIDGLAGELKVSRQTIESYLDLLERSYVIFRVQAFSNNLRKEITKGIKIYFWDSGVRNAILKDFSLSPLRGDIGALFESWVMAEVAKRNIMLDSGKSDVRFWRKTQGGEIDLVIKGTDTFKAYEIKWSKQNATSSIKSFTNAYNVPVKVITKNTILDLLWQEDER